MSASLVLGCLSVGLGVACVVAMAFFPGWVGKAVERMFPSDPPIPPHYFDDLE